MQRFSQEQHRAAIERLQRLVAESTQSQASLRASHESRDQTTAAQFESEKSQLEAAYQAEKAQHSRAQTDQLAQIALEYEQRLERAKTAQATSVAQVEARFNQLVGDARREHHDARSAADRQYDAEVKSATQDLQQAKAQIEEGTGQLSELEAKLIEVVRKRRCRRAARELPALQPVTSNQPAQQFPQELAAATAAMGRFAEHWAASFLASGWLFVIFIFSWIFAVLVGHWAGVLAWPWVIAGGAVALAVTSIVYVAVRPIMVRQTIDLYQEILQHHTNAEMALEGVRALAVANADQRRVSQRQQRDADCKAADRVLQSRTETLASQRSEEIQQLAETLSANRKQLAETRAEQQRQVNGRFELLLAEAEERFGNQLEQLRIRHGQELESVEESFQRRQERLSERFQQGMAEFTQTVEEACDYSQRYFPSWSEVDWATWTAPEQESPSVRFGQYSVEMKGDVGQAEFLPENEDSSLTVPAISSFSSRPVLLWESWGDGRAHANRSIRNVMLRIFTSFPPGKTRFTIIDPVGLGQNFSAFMHLADIDEKLVSHRIWTESSQVNQRLADLTEHMEGIIQTYLRNEYASIDEYNRHAGEVAEPFHILAVANFPAGFTEESAARLLAIASSGVQCGVFTLISTDSKLEMPRGFDLADLEAQAVTLQWDGQAFQWLDPILKDLRLELDEPPKEDLFTKIVHAVGQRARVANHVEVPFRTVAPEAGWWEDDSRAEVVVPLGRAGANKLQRLALGKGTSQHLLISGKTGSGKSTLLHALIMNTALHYSPDEVEFYLIDFKKGVEFKPYAEYQLPHARIVAIESEREFGISVLGRLDAEMRQRGDIFRQRGVQDIRSFRDAYPKEKMPRVMLVVDEFQELFVQDDKLAQDAALMLDRLVRQGRAFGIHVLLGSQTLAGTYSLARSTIGQMAVRIALQCSEADSHLILSEENTAARLLDRPGEAIYNDANGLFEGNHPFQVVWLSAEEQEQHLRQLGVLARERGVQVERPIVFEGNAAADAGENTALRQCLESTPAVEDSPLAWLGSAVAIKDPTSVTFHQQGGSNLVLVGQQEEAAMGILSTAIISLVATCADGESASPRFTVLNGAAAKSAPSKCWKQLQERVPAEIEVVGPKRLPASLVALHSELQRRAAEPDEAWPPLFVAAFQLSRLRDLRRADDDFGFSGLDDKASLTPAQQFVELLREGPALGIHVLIWCDSFNNLSRWFDRQVLREVDHRVLFQMSASDSSNLMDSPAASRLGENRAVLFSEEQGSYEKFRPYAAPTRKLLDEFCHLLTARGKG